MSDSSPEAEHVLGERDANSISRLVSNQSRVSNILAIGLMSVLGLGALTWYYANAFARQGRAKDAAQAAAVKKAQGDLPLPSLGRIDPPVVTGLLPPATTAVDSPAIPPPLAPQTLLEMPLSQNAAVSNSPPPKTPEQLAQERRLSGAVFASLGSIPAGTYTGGADNEVGANGAGPGMPAGIIGGGAPAGGSSTNSGVDLPALLHPSVTTAVRARVLPAKRLLLPKGAFIDCTLETSIDSTLPGMTTCVMATDAFGVDGQVVLLERGTKLMGETRGQVQQGSARIFVVWTEARTPTGVIVPLTHRAPMNSAAPDYLGM